MKRCIKTNRLSKNLLNRTFNISQVSSYDIQPITMLALQYLQICTEVNGNTIDLVVLF